jgi:O-antigen/teichoic acid export membrane protein
MKQKAYNFLRWTEKYTQTDMVYLTKGGFWLTAGNIIASAASFVLAIAFGNLLSKETYGIYKYILSILGLLVIANLPGMETSVARSVAQSRDGSFFDSLKAKIKWGFLGGLASLVLSAYYYSNQNNTLALCFLIAAVFVPFMDSLQIYQAILNGRKLFKDSAKYTALGQIIVAGAMVLTLILTKNIFLIIVAYFLSSTLSRYIFLKITVSKTKLNKTKDPAAVPFGIHLTLMNVVGMIADQLDKIIMWHFLGAAALAVYSFALAPVSQITNFLKSVPQLSLPKFASQNKEEIKKTLPKKMAKFFLILLAGTLIYIFLAPYFFKIFFPKYLESIKYSIFYSLAILFFPQKIISSALTMHAKTKVLYIMQSVSPAVRIILLAILLPLYGINGAILALLIPQALNTFISFYFLKTM